MTANIVFFSVFNPGLATDIVGVGFLSVAMGLCEFCAGGSYPFENPRKNKRREKRPAPVGGVIAAIRRKSRKTAEKGPDLKALDLFRCLVESAG
ncbi:hypothetical protein [Bradyrhizobium shewense]|uniref:hypothetical protein n=1 Tax=Bradyrhizobium shewense TaxID=1761772 RepID=UPI000B8A56CF|nr:hypothetical protein [Bradyrhizobium shewense]